MIAVPERVRAAFALRGEPVRLPGGVSGVVRYGDVVVKPVTDVPEAEWVQSTLATLPQPADLRWATPVATVDGGFVADGWIGHEYLPGIRPARPDWEFVLDAGRRFHRATAEVTPPVAMLAARAHRWARGERHAFDEEAVPLPAEAAALDRDLADRCRPDDGRTQVVHVDLLTNVFVDRFGVPVVLDIAPGDRSPRYSAAVAVGDALLWDEAPAAVVDLLGDRDDAHALLARAARFRMATEQIALTAGTRSAHGGDLTPYRRLLTLMS